MGILLGCSVQYVQIHLINFAQLVFHSNLLVLFGLDGRRRGTMGYMALGIATIQLAVQHRRVPLDTTPAHAQTEALQERGLQQTII